MTTENRKNQINQVKQISNHEIMLPQLSNISTLLKYTFYGDSRPHGIFTSNNNLEWLSGPATITGYRVVRKYAIIMCVVDPGTP